MSEPKYHWAAVYRDTTRLPQYEADGKENRYEDIDRSRLIAFEFWKTVYHPEFDSDGRPLLDDQGQPKLVAEDWLLLVTEISEEARLIYRRRVELVQGGEPRVMYLIGWQKTINGANTQSIACVCTWLEDRIVFIDGWKENTPWFYSVVELPCEQS